MFSAQYDVFGDNNEIAIIVFEHFADKDKEVQGIYTIQEGGDFRLVEEEIEELYGISVEVPTLH